MDTIKRDWNMYDLYTGAWNGDIGAMMTDEPVRSIGAILSGAARLPRTVDTYARRDEHGNREYTPPGRPNLSASKIREMRQKISNIVCVSPTTHVRMCGAFPLGSAAALAGRFYSRQYQRMVK